MSLASLAALALFAPASATATKLCKAPENPECLMSKTWNPFWSLFEIELKKEYSARFITDFFTVKCTKSEFNLIVTEEGTPLENAITEMTFANCENGCKAQTRNQPLLTYIYQYEGTYNGKVWIVPTSGARPSWKLECSGYTCIYGAEEIELEFVSGSTPELWAIEEPLTLEEGKCTQGAKFNGFYTFGEVPVYVTG